jgi:mono/diheme cytochrome c family protein
MKIQRELLLTGLAALVGLSATAALAETSEQAESLHETHCLSCHGTEVYTREERLVGSLDGLERQVQRCETALGLSWFDEDIKSVATYLNHHFYQFER